MNMPSNLTSGKIGLFLALYVGLISCISSLPHSKFYNTRQRSICGFESYRGVVSNSKRRSLTEIDPLHIPRGGETRENDDEKKSEEKHSEENIESKKTNTINISKNENNESVGTEIYDDTTFNESESDDIDESCQQEIIITTTHDLVEESDSLEGTSSSISETDSVSSESDFQLNAHESSELNLLIESNRDKASQLRVEGKELHDSGELDLAATTFHKAASILDGVLSEMLSSSSEYDNKPGISLLQEIHQESATCRLHQALCALKSQQYQQCIDTCTFLLEDDVTSVQGKSDSTTDQITDNSFLPEITTTTVMHTSPISPQPSLRPYSSSTLPTLSTAIRARAHHRRAKAKLALSDAEGALEDARTAAFLGDRGAVDLYGRLMRENGNMDDYTNTNPLFPSSNENLQSLFNSFSSEQQSTNNNPLGLGSLLGSSLMTKDENKSSNISPFGSNSGIGQLGSLASLLMNNSPGPNNNPSFPSSSLTKSILSTLTEKIESESTQESICNFLNSASSAQISGLASMANVPLSSQQISKIISVAHSVTPQKISKGVKWTKRSISFVKIFSKVLRVLKKYWHLLVYMMVLQWIKSAVNRPIIVKKRK